MIPANLLLSPGDVVDLSAAIAAFPPSKYRPFKTAVRRFSDAYSSLFDLQRALRLMENAVALVAGTSPRETGAPQDQFAATLAGAGFDKALLLYVQVVTNNDDRKRVPVEKDGSEEVIAAHNRVLGLRNGGIGHFGYTVDHQNGWSAVDRVLIVADVRGSKIIGESRRSNYKASTSADLAMVLHHATTSIITILDDRGADVWEEMEKLPLEAQEHVLSFRTAFDPRAQGGTRLYAPGAGG